MLRLGISKSGQQIATINGVSLHSSYDPKKEATRFIETAISGKVPATILLLGAGLGYISQAIKIRFPHTKLICVYYESSVFHKSFLKGDINWHPGLGIEIVTFFGNHLSELDVEGLENIEWPPSSLIYKGTAQRVHSSLQQVLRELSGSLITTVGAGKLWLKNTFYNFLCLEKIVGGRPCTDHLPLVIIASGPSLEKSLPLLKAYRKRLILWSLPSALKFCRAHNITPDLVVVTDPGYYSTYHFHSNYSEELTLALPLSVSRGLWHQKGKFFLFSQPNFFEQAIFDRARIKVPRISSNGTVAGSALELALKFTKKRIFIIGLDLCYNDIFSHARPYTIDEVFYNSSQKFSPYLHNLYVWSLKSAPVIIKSKSCRTSRAYHTYSGWFSSLPQTVKQKIYRINPSTLALPGIGTINTDEMNLYMGSLSDKKQKTHFQILTDYPDYSKRKDIAASIIKKWFKYLNEKQNLFLKGDKTLRIFEDKLLLNLCYFISAQKLLELKRNIRNTNPIENKKITTLLFDETISFLTGLLDKIIKR
jgi:hypothetical protein